MFLFISQFLLPNLDDSSSEEKTRITELNTEVELSSCDNGKEMQSINSEADSLVDTNELLEFIDTMDIGESGDVDQSVSVIEPEQIVTSRIILILNLKVSLAHSCHIMKVSHPQWIQVQMRRS